MTEPDANARTPMLTGGQRPVAAQTTVRLTQPEQPLPQAVSAIIIPLSSIQNIHTHSFAFQLSNCKYSTIEKIDN